MRKTRKTLVSLVFLLLIFAVAFGQSIQWIETIKVPPEAKVLSPPTSFCLIDMDIFLIPDIQTGSMKVFEKKENSLKIVDPYGPGDGLFTKPVCFYSKNVELLGILDYVMRKGYIFKRNGAIGFESIKTFDCKKFGYDIKFAGDGIQIIISGYITDKEGNPFDLYCINIETGQFDYLLPSNEKYGLKTHVDYLKEYYRRETLPAIGIKAFFDIQGDDLFFVWEGALRIIKFNFRTKSIRQVFGHETRRYYTKPDGSRLSESYIKGDFDTTWKLQEKFSYVRNIFVTANNVFVVYETGKKNEGDVSTFRLQIYTLDGQFIKDLLIPNNPGRQMSFDRTSNELYALTNGAGNNELAILKYLIGMR